MVKFQWVCPPNQCWRVDILDLQQLPPSQKKKDTLILRCCVDNLCWNYFPWSRFNGYDPQISVDVLTFLIDSTCYQVGKRSIPWFCDAALTFHLEIIFHAQVSKGMTPKSVLTCWLTWLTALATCSSFKGYYPQISVDVLTFLIDSACHPVSKRRIPWFCDAALTFHLEIIFQAQVSKGITPKSVLTCWHSWLTALSIQLAKEMYTDFAMLRWLSIWKLFFMLRFQRVWPPNQRWHVDILDWQYLPSS